MLTKFSKKRVAGYVLERESADFTVAAGVDSNGEIVQAFNATSVAGARTIAKRLWPDAVEHKPKRKSSRR